MSPPPFLIGEWRVEPSRNRLTSGRESRRLTPKAMEVLVLLAARAGEAVSREEIFEGVWFDVHVQEEVLTRAISDLRKALDDDRRAPRYIETIPKRGYRILAEVAPAPSAAPAKKTRRIPVTATALALVIVGLAALAGTLAFRSDRPATPLVLEGNLLTTFPRREIQPAVSPDGGYVAFSWEGAAGNDWDLYLKPIGGEEIRKLTEGPGIDLSPTWSPDGEWIAFSRYSPGEECRILEVSPTEGSMRELASCGKSQNPDLSWSPDGKKLAFSDRESDSESFGIHLLFIETGERRKLVSPGGQHWGDKDPAFSPDGSWIAFIRSVSMNTQDVYRIRLEGGEPERVTFDGRELRGLAYAPDGRSLYVSSAREGNLSLWRIPLDGGTLERLVYPGGAPRAPSVGPLGQLVFEERSRDGDIASRALDEARPSSSPLIVSTREDREPAVSPDGRRLGFVSSRSGSPEIWTADASRGGGAVRRSSFGGPSVGAPSWSPDGRLLAFDARPGGNADLYLVEVEGGDPKALVVSPENEIAPSFSPDGKDVYFGSDRGGRWQIWRASVGSGAEGRVEAVTRNGGYVGRPSPDGRFLYFTRFEAPGLHRLALSTRIEEEIPGTEGLADGASWCFDEDDVLFVAFTSESTRLLRVRNEGRVQDLGLIESDFGGGLALDAGKGRVLFTRLARTESDLVVAALP